MASDEHQRQKKLLKKRRKDRAKKRKPAAQPAATLRVVPPHELNIAREAEYIIRRAQGRDSRIISLGALVFFSTETGDAWLLDKEDGLALCLCRDGARQPFNITDTPANFSIEWQYEFGIEGDAFCLVDRDANRRVIHGYPLREIRHALTERA